MPIDTRFTNNHNGFEGEVSMLNAYGGIMSPIEIADAPLLSVDSGPAMAPVSGRITVLSNICGSRMAAMWAKMLLC
jgi:hypothetical protein